MEIETVGSYNDFAKTRGGEIGAETLQTYSEELTNWRLTQAAALGISVEDLHAGPLIGLTQGEAPDV